jgi:Na+/phosphate symporter
VNQKLSKIPDLICHFQSVILELSARLHDDKTLSEEDIENTHYVIGMAQINSENLQTAFERGDASEKVCRLIEESTALVGSFNKEGCGLPCKTC